MGGAQSSYTNKEGEGERTIINGHHETKVFQDLLDKFIEKYVLCQNCNLPEIDMVVKKNGAIMAACKACGWSGELDPAHKVATFIVKNPPDTGIGFDADTGKKAKASREERQKARAERKRLDEEGGGADDSGNDSDKPKKSKKEKKEKSEKKDKKDKKEKKEKKDKKDKNEKKIKRTRRKRKRNPILTKVTPIPTRRK